MLTIRFFAAAKAATGKAMEQIDLNQLDGPPTRGSVENLLIEWHPDPPAGEPPLVEVLARCSFLLDGQSCPTPEAEIHDGATLDILPPFAGG
ncbi:MoaD/ThiS family protein [Kocuria coralli]|uniref:MoaD/ThiS family protein n=1 Tax=Kocuria coralli TaxID=1461025 RepID=A0A5J5KXF8_9MICC|nr:MoaD/ThiS family protein [Kocuria coralli]KAA9394192.1 MoaD/ThiS family protein [Kocuria coralli]